MILKEHPDSPRDGIPAIGYWFNSHHPSFPKPEDYVDLKWRAEEREAVARYLASAPMKHSWRGWSNCRVCGVRNGSQCLSDGSYVWLDGFAHYVRDHGVRPPDEFVAHVLQKVLKNDFSKSFLPKFHL